MNNIKLPYLITTKSNFRINRSGDISEGKQQARLSHSKLFNKKEKCVKGYIHTWDWCVCV